MVKILHAKKEVYNEIRKSVIPYCYEVTPFSEREIIEFLDVSMNIRDPLFVNQIVKIAEGKPRLAYMAGTTAKKTNDLASVYDVNEIYAQYYSPIIESLIGIDKSLFITMGILSALRVIHLGNLNLVKSLINEKGLSEEMFRDSIMNLVEREIVSLKDNKIARIEDQGLANYVLNYVYIVRKYLRLSDVIEIGFKSRKREILDSVNTLLNLFYSEETYEMIEHAVWDIWDKFEKTNSYFFMDFACEFHLFRPEDALVLASQEIDKIPQEKKFLI